MRWRSSEDRPGRCLRGGRGGAGGVAGRRRGHRTATVHHAGSGCSTPKRSSAYSTSCAQRRVWRSGWTLRSSRHTGTKGGSPPCRSPAGRVRWGRSAANGTARAGSSRHTHAVLRCWLPESFVDTGTVGGDLRWLRDHHLRGGVHRTRQAPHAAARTRSGPLARRAPWGR